MNLNPINLFSKKYQSDKKNVKLIIDNICTAICGSLGNGGFPNQEIYLAIDEAVSNAMEHGNNWDKKKSVSINVLHENDELKIIVTDEGDGFETRNITYELDKDNILKHRGRGIFIMNRFCELKWNEKGNELTMKIRKNFMPTKINQPGK